MGYHFLAKEQVMFGNGDKKNRLKPDAVLLTSSSYSTEAQ